MFMNLNVSGCVIKCVVVCIMLIGNAAWSIELPAGPLAKLQVDEFSQRELAQADLLRWAREHHEAGLDAVFKHSRVAEDPEVRDRCLAVVRELVNDDYLNDGEGFIGIRMLDELANIPGDPKPCKVIRVVQVVADSAAQNAGLQLNDLIVGVGDQVWHEGAASLLFSEQIRQLKPKTKLTLKVLRNGKPMVIDVTLGRRPQLADQLFLDRQVDPEALERAAKDAYFRRWLERRKSPN